MFTEENTPYLVIGEETGVRKLVERFYYHMDTNPKAKRCRELHTDSLESISEKLVLFLQGWLSGPAVYIEKYGHPMMRKRHFPFKIGPVERDEWLLCMRLAMDEMDYSSEFDTALFASFTQFSEHMRNSD